MEGTAPLVCMLIAVGVTASFAPLVWSAFRDRITSMHLNEEMNEETLEAVEQDWAEWEAEAEAFLGELARKEQVAAEAREADAFMSGLDQEQDQPASITTIKTALMGGTIQPIMIQKSMPQDRLNRRLAAARRVVAAA